MRVKLNQIDEETFSIRKEVSKEYIKELSESLKADGQWDPIIVRPNGKGEYELISGHCRVLAARKAGWKEIEAVLKDVDDVEANILSLKTNLLRSTLSEVEEGRAIQKMMENHGLTQTEVSRRLGRSSQWVQQRLSLVLGIIDEVRDALSEGKISPEHAFVISQISESKFKNWKAKQREFLGLVLKHKWSRDEARRQLKRYLNDTVFTAGYEGRSLEEFANLLRENKIALVVDIRQSAESQHKPEFNKKILGRELQKGGIKYIHRPEFGVPYALQNPYKDGGLSLECLEQWYRWHISNETDLPDLMVELKDIGRPLLLCAERYARKGKKQKMDCHRDILARLILETATFEKRLDL